METNKILNGECLEEMKKFPDNSVDSIVTDPPYGISFMSKKWDYDVPSVDMFKEMLRIAKPGAHILCFGGSRTYHRMAVNVEDAGWEIKDTIQYLYGSGFPKSMNISKAIDKKFGAEREVVGVSNNGSGIQPNKINNHGKGDTGIGYADGSGKSFDITKPSTDEAKEWEGWGTNLKPAYEPIILARKPIEEKTIAENVLKYGTGGINIDSCRINLNGDYKCKANGRPSQTGLGDNYNSEEANKPDIKGRFPANVILTHHPECEKLGYKKVKPSNGSGVAGNNKGKGLGKNKIWGVFKGVKAEDQTAIHVDKDGKETVENWNCHDDCPIKILDEQSGVSKSSGGIPKSAHTWKGFDGDNKGLHVGGLGDKGGASRFFYTAKASKSERGKDNIHPTVKPIKLMEYLVTLITPKEGICLDPFCGSGSTLIACKKNRYKYIGIEREEEYCKISEDRLKSIKISSLDKFMKKREK